jgi:hypothetical protein
MCHVKNNETPQNAAQNHFLKGIPMKAKSIILGNTYHMTLGRNEVLGEVIAETETGWQVRLTASDKVIKVNSPDRFLRKARMIATTQDEAADTVQDTKAIKSKAKTSQTENVEAKREGLSGLDAAHRVLVEIGKPLNARQIAEAILERGYCPNLKGKTPQATISSSMQREITRLGDESRFYKAGKGQFAAVECRQK